MSNGEQQSEVVGLMRDVLADQYTHLHVRRVVVEENLVDETTSITCEVTDDTSGGKSVIAGKGVGVIDAFFAGVVSRFATEYPSLKTVQFHSFSVAAQLDTKKEFSGTDSEARVTLQVLNSEDKVFTFTHSSRSVTSSAIITTLAALEYFINSERAFVTMYHALKDAKERNRSDLVQRYTNIMASLVNNTSYSEVIDRIRKDL